MQRLHNLYCNLIGLQTLCSGNKLNPVKSSLLFFVETALHPWYARLVVIKDFDYLAPLKCAVLLDLAFLNLIARPF